MADHRPTIHYKNSRNFRVCCRKILIKGIFFFFTYMIHIPGFTPRAFSVIEVTEQVYLGVLSSSLNI